MNILFQINQVKLAEILKLPVYDEFAIEIPKIIEDIKREKINAELSNNIEIRKTVQASVNKAWAEHKANERRNPDK